jgi:hypothetical protein
MLDLLFLEVVDLGTFLVRLLTGVLDQSVSTLLGLDQDRLLHLFDTLLDVA